MSPRTWSEEESSSAIGHHSSQLTSRASLMWAESWNFRTFNASGGTPTAYEASSCTERICLACIACQSVKYSYSIFSLARGTAGFKLQIAMINEPIHKRYLLPKHQVLASMICELLLEQSQISFVTSERETRPEPLCPHLLSPLPTHRECPWGSTLHSSLLPPPAPPPHSQTPAIIQ